MIQLVDFADEAANLGKIVVVSALNSDFRKQSWPSIAGLMPLAEKVKNLSSICKICGTNAAFTFKKEVSTADQIENVQIGGADMYMPLCRECYNEKTRQQRDIKIGNNSVGQADSNDVVEATFGSSTTLAESTN